MANPLGSCVASLRSSNALLSSSISILDSGVNDFPRLAKVLQTTRHFELLPESSLQSAQSTLLSSLTPEIETLLTRVDTHLSKLERREQSLIARSELLEGRIGEGRASLGGGGVGVGDKGRKGGVGGGGIGTRKGKDGEFSREALRLKQLRRKKEALEYAVERLNLQAQQRQRQLRMSVAAQ